MVAHLNLIETVDTLKTIKVELKLQFSGWKAAKGEGAEHKLITSVQNVISVFEYLCKHYTSLFNGAEDIDPRVKKNSKHYQLPHFS